MQDISTALVKVIEDKKCSSLLAFIEVKDGIHIQQPESKEEFSGGLCNQGNIITNGEALGIHLHRNSSTGV